MQEKTIAEPALIIPGLRTFYDRMIPLSWAIVRFGVGWNLSVHAYGKVLRGMAGQAKLLEHDIPNFVSLTLPLAYLLTFVEGVGGLCIIVGLFTRFFAAACALELAFITFVLYWANGFSWLHRGYEYTLLWGFMCLAIALRGGGPYSLDRRIGKEL